MAQNVIFRSNHAICLGPDKFNRQDYRNNRLIILLNFEYLALV